MNNLLGLAPFGLMREIASVRAESARVHATVRVISFTITGWFDPGRVGGMSPFFFFSFSRKGQGQEKLYEPSV